jgi:hypothetical protein
MAQTAGWQKFVRVSNWVITVASALGCVAYLALLLWRDHLVGPVRDFALTIRWESISVFALFFFSGLIGLLQRRRTAGGGHRDS